MRYIKTLIVTKLLIISCNAAIHSQITSDFDKSVDFTQYKTYKFLGISANKGLMRELSPRFILFKHEYKPMQESTRMKLRAELVEEVARFRKLIKDPISEWDEFQAGRREESDK